MRRHAAQGRRRLGRRLGFRRRPVRRRRHRAHSGPGATTGTTLKIGKVKRAGRKLRVALTAQGGTVKGIRIVVRKGRKAVAKGKLATLTGKRTVVVKAKRRIKRGRYTIRVTAPGAKSATRKLKVR